LIGGKLSEAKTSLEFWEMMTRKTFQMTLIRLFLN